MSDDIASPVNGIIKAFNKGNERARKICNAASKDATASRVLDNVEPAQALQMSLADSEAAVRYAYSEGVRMLGERYSNAIQSGPLTSGPLKDVTINLKELLETLSDYIEEPDNFDLGSFKIIQRESERCRDQATDILGSLHQRMLNIQQSKIPTQDNRKQLTSQRQVTGARPDSQISPMNTVAPQSSTARIATEEKRTATRISNPSHYEVNIPTELNIPTGTSYGSYKGEGRSSASRAESSSRQDSGVQLINRAEVVRQMTSNEDFLEKRLMSRQSFRHDMEYLRQSSTSSTGTISPCPGFPQTPPSLAYTTEFSEIPIATSSPTGYLLIARTQSREGQSSLSTKGLSPWDGAPILEPQDSAMSELLLFGPPESPPHSGRQSVAEGHGTLARTLKFPGYSEGVPDGIQDVGQLFSDPGLILANENHDQPTPATSVKSMDYPMRSDTSFHKLNGFCPGAHMIRRGVKGAQEVRKKPGAHLDAHISVKCIKCKYEISWELYDKDNFLDRAGIYTIGDIRFRQRFLSKCHMPSAHTDEVAYACIFCVDGGKTVDDYDATVFFTLKKFFHHLMKHTRPVRAVEGIVVLYNNPDVVDFDIDFKTMKAKCSPFINVEGIFRNHPTAHAIVDHRERARNFKKVDPEQRATLQFALGARIVGITYSQRTNGAWCFGYHDGDSGYFPTSTVAFDIPAKEEVPTNTKSTLWGTAKWEHKPREAHSRWLVFKKGDKITHIDYASPDAWCYSGHHKGKWGLFPACFVQGLKQDVLLGQAVPSSERHGSGDSSPRGHTGIGLFIKRRTMANSTTSGTLSSGGSAFSTRILELSRSPVPSTYNERPDLNISKEHAQRDIAPSALQKLLTGGSLEAVEELLDKQFANIAQGEYSWLHELVDIGYTTREMAELLFQKFNDTPWIYFEQQKIPNGTVTLGIHIPGCAHQGGCDLNFPPRLITTAPDEHSLELSGLTWPTRSENLKRIVAEFCGLAGIAPTTRDRNGWYGHVAFEDNNSTAFVTYGLDAERHNVSSHDTIISRAFRVLENFCNAAGQVQKAGFCCDCFTVLVITFTNDESKTAELHRIELELALRLRAELHSMLSPGQRQYSLIWDVSMDILGKATIQTSETHSVPAMTRLSGVRNIDDVLNLCCLAIQFLCLGFLSYIQAHTGAIQPFFLDTAQKKVVLQGIRGPNKAYPQVLAQLLDLTCIGDMINESVLVFSSYIGGAKSLPKSESRLDLFASPEDLIDTWGPGQFISTSGVDETGIYAVTIGGGVISAVDKDSRKFHWSPASQPYGSFAQIFDPSTKIVIGSGIKVNDACLANENQRWLNSGDLLQNLGTFQGHWEAAQRQAGIQAGQYFNISYLKTWAKTPTATLKQIQLSHPDNHLLPFLESYWGLQVSFCTGIARRVPLRELLADIMPAFVESLIPIPELWDSLLNRYKILDAFYSENLQEWLGRITDNYQKQVAVIIRSILSVLQHTGVDRKGEMFVIAWIRKKKPFQCFKIGCEKESYWARILADSTDCATFAYVTSKCLETDGYKCRGPTAIWHNQSALLGTSVCRYKPNGPGTQDRGTALSTWTLKHAEKYLMGKPELLERVQVDIQIQGAEPRLHVLPSTIPRVVRLRLDTDIIRRLCRLREKQALDALAENVVVLAGRPE